MARVLNGIGVLALQSGDYTTARQRYQESAGLFETLGEVRGVATAQLNLGIALINLDQLTAARESLVAARDRFVKIGDDRERAHCLQRLGFIEELEGRPGAALALTHQALDINRNLGNRLGLADAIHCTADLEASHGSEEAAAKLLIEALELFLDLDALTWDVPILSQSGVMCTD